MAGVYASWVHGSSAQPERPGFFVNSLRAGFGTQFLSHNTGEWFHLAIPTPVLIDGKRAALVKVLFRYATVHTAKITAVHLYDGEEKFHAFENLSLASGVK